MDNDNLNSFPAFTHSFQVGQLPENNGEDDNSMDPPKSQIAKRDKLKNELMKRLNIDSDNFFGEFLKYNY